MAAAGPGQGYASPQIQQQPYYPPPQQQPGHPQGYQPPYQSGFNPSPGHPPPGQVGPPQYGQPPPGQVGPTQYGQPQVGYVAQPQPGYGNQTSQVVIQQPMQVHKPVELGRQPVSTVCPNCRATIVTKLSRHPGTATFVYCCILSCVCCCCLPFCLECAKDVDHKCPNCKYLLGTYKSPVTGDRGGGGGTFQSAWDRPAPDHYGGGGGGDDGGGGGDGGD